MYIYTYTHIFIYPYIHTSRKSVWDIARTDALPDEAMMLLFSTSSGMVAVDATIAAATPAATLQVLDTLERRVRHTIAVFDTRDAC